MMQRYPIPRCFAKRVRIWLIARELTFLATTKSSQEYDSAGFVLPELPQERTACENTLVGGRGEGLNGDTVS
jgi:hypothetical protein